MQLARPTRIVVRRKCSFLDLTYYGVVQVIVHKTVTIASKSYYYTFPTKFYSTTSCHNHTFDWPFQLQVHYSRNISLKLFCISIVKGLNLRVSAFLISISIFIYSNHVKEGTTWALVDDSCAVYSKGRNLDVSPNLH